MSADTDAKLHRIAGLINAARLAVSYLSTDLKNDGASDEAQAVALEMWQGLHRLCDDSRADEASGVMCALWEGLREPKEGHVCAGCGEKAIEDKNGDTHCCGDNFQPEREVVPGDDDPSWRKCHGESFDR